MQIHKKQFRHSIRCVSNITQSRPIICSLCKSNVYCCIYINLFIYRKPQEAKQTEMHSTL